MKRVIPEPLLGPGGSGLAGGRGDRRDGNEPQQHGVVFDPGHWCVHGNLMGLVVWVMDTLNSTKEEDSTKAVEFHKQGNEKK